MVIDSSLAPLNLPPVGDITPAGWPARRAQWLELLADHVYGTTPQPAWSVAAEPLGERVVVHGGIGAREQVRLVVSDGVARRHLDVLLVLPTGGPSPVVAALNFFGNHATSEATDVALPTSWVPDRPEMVPSDGHRAAEVGRGLLARQWPVELLLRAGFGLATLYAGDAAPDDPSHAVDGLLSLDHPAAENPWGALGVWAWGLSAVRAYLAEREDVRADAIAALGHSRMGKAALWAAAQDEGFAGAVSVQSGCGGASLSRRSVGEDIAAITSRFPHWFTPVFAGYAGREHELPVDQHQLLAAIAPRALYVTSAVEDDWADPLGEHLATAAALPVHRALGTARVGYHVRPGGHSLSTEDWEHALTFLRRHLADNREESGR